MLWDRYREEVDQWTFGMFKPVCYFGFSLESRSLELQSFLAVGDFEVKPEIKIQLKLSRLYKNQYRKEAIVIYRSYIIYLPVSFIDLILTRCVFETQCPHNGQFQRRPRSNILIPVERSCHKKWLCAIWKL